MKTFHVAISAIAALVLGASGVASAQDPPPPATPAVPLSTDVRLERIERKLDEILRRMGLNSEPDARQPGAAALPNAPPIGAVPAIDATAYKPGAIALDHEAPAYARDLPQIPADSVGGFVYSGGPITLNDLKTKGVRFTGLAGIELQGWLRVAVSGRTQIAVEYRANGPNSVGISSCIANISLENRSIGSQSGEIALPASTDKTIDLNLGADLQPGLYRLHLWAVCTPLRDLKLTAEILIKSPSDMNLRGLNADERLAWL